MNEFTLSPPSSFPSASISFCYEITKDRCTYGNNRVLKSKHGYNTTTVVRQKNNRETGRVGRCTNSMSEDKTEIVVQVSQERSYTINNPKKHLARETHTRWQIISSQLSICGIAV